MIQNSLSGQVSNTDEQSTQTYLSNTDVCSNQQEQGTQTDQSTNKPTTDDDTSGDIELSMLDVLENVKIEANDYNEYEPFLNNGTVN